MGPRSNRLRCIHPSVHSTASIGGAPIPVKRGACEMAHCLLDHGYEVCYTPGTQGEETAMFGIGLPELVVILAVALIVLGPQRLPEVARMLGRAYGQLRRASEEFQNTIRQDLAALERQEDANRNKAIAQEIRERCADVEDVQTAIIQERDGHG